MEFKKYRVKCVSEIEMEDNYFSTHPSHQENGKMRQKVERFSANEKGYAAQERAKQNFTAAPLPLVKSNEHTHKQSHVVAIVVKLL